MRFIIIASAFFTSAAFGCGGAAIKEKEVRIHPLVGQWKTTFESSVGESLKLKEVKLAGRDFLDMDMNPTASAMCSANFVFAFFRNADSSIVCKLNLEGSSRGLVLMDSSRYKGQCRLANGSMINF